MTKIEFEELAGRTVSEEEYKVIATVYQWHPSVKETSGKAEVAELYKSFGMAVFYDLLPRAEKNRELERQLIQVQEEEVQIRQEKYDLALGISPEMEKTALENKKAIVIRLKLLLMATRAGSGIKELILSGDQKTVTVKFRNGSEQKVNVAGDSGIALIRDVMKIFD